MKKLIAIMLVSLTMAGCTNSGSSSSSSSSGTSVDMGGSSPAPSQSSASGEVLTGLASVASLEKTKPAGDGKGGMAQADVTSCAVTFDADGKILGIRFDTVECKVEFDDKGTLVTDLTAAVKSKRELGDEYNMKPASGIGKEWYTQVDALEKWMVGKNMDEVLGMKTTKKDDKTLADEADLKSSVTIGVGDFLASLEKAYKSVK